jgi:copper chaperone CopZ
MENVIFKLVGMGCSCEGSIVEKRVKKLRGVESYVLNPFTNQLRVSFDPDTVTMADIQKTVQKAGVRAVLMGDSVAAAREPQTFGGGTCCGPQTSDSTEGFSCC